MAPEALATKTTQRAEGGNACGSTLASPRQKRRTEQIDDHPSSPQALAPHSFFGDVPPATSCVFLQNSGQLHTVPSGVGALLHCLILFPPTYFYFGKADLSSVSSPLLSGA